MKDGASTITIRQIAGTSDTALALVRGSEAALREVYTAEECFSVPPEGLGAQNLMFYAAFLGEAPVGCVCLVDMVHYGEVKRFYVDPAHRGQGIGDALMDHLETEARGLGLTLIKLETGPKLAAATALYQRRGYVECARFGDYPESEASSYFEKRLG